jgi:uncharacterized protein YkwD
MAAGLAVSMVSSAPEASAIMMKSSRPDSQAWADRYNKRLTLLINRERKHHGLRTVPATSCASSWADSWSSEMAQKDEFVHSDLGRLLDKCHATYASENIAMIYDGAYPKDLVRAWMNSPGHRANILSGKPQFTGVSVRWDDDQSAWIAVQNFVRK